jgi:hypothetical protein
MPGAGGVGGGFSQIPGGALGAASLGSGKMGGGSGGGGAGDAGAAQAQLATLLAAQSDPLRQSLIDRSEQFVGGNLDVTASPAFSAFKNQTEGQYQNARDNIIASTPTGGGLTAALTELEGNRASSLGQGAGSLAETELARALNLATGTTGQAVSGLGNAAMLQGQLAQSEADREAGLYSALGTGIGAYAGMKA